MKIISLWEPWMTFMLRGYKKWETRSWAPSYRGPIALHAAKTRECLDDAGFKLTEAGIKASIFDPDPPGFPQKPEDWPLGCIVAVATLKDCISTEKATPSAQEKALGDYSPERFAWVFENFRLVKPLAFRGMQGLKDLPAEVEAKLEYLAAA